MFLSDWFPQPLGQRLRQMVGWWRFRKCLHWDYLVHLSLLFDTEFLFSHNSTKTRTKVGTNNSRMAGNKEHLSWDSAVL